MLVAHLPAGYILAAKLRKRYGHPCFWPVIIGSVFPDLDTLYFYLVDDRRTLHHHYLFHRPVYWLMTGIVAVIILALFKRRRDVVRLSWFLTGVLLHLFLDTIAGKIDWLYPFSEHSFAFVEVPAKYGWWVWNFIFHWTFCLEIALLVWAIVILIRPGQDSYG
ncbi:MAG: metal-dependent hydrolase [Elusimicrobia bacterium]|nr:metal-dependent hydrolase [Elusimicrobiota bacterium]